MDDHQHRIDQLLGRYLTLLDEYTRLRRDLSGLQRDMFHNLARANFSAERGVRYGQDYYDQRMQATRRLAIHAGEGGVPVFSWQGKKEQEEQAKGTATPDSEEEKGNTKDDAKDDAKQKRPNNDPLRWFALLAPQPLRTAQNQSVQALDDVVPRLVSVNAEMQAVEIEVRRARKRRAKVEASAAKMGQGAGGGAMEGGQERTNAVETA